MVHISHTWHIFHSTRTHTCTQDPIPRKNPLMPKPKKRLPSISTSSPPPYSRDWSELYSIYGLSDDPPTLAFLLLHSLLGLLLSFLISLHVPQYSSPPPLVLPITALLAALSSLCLLSVTFHLLHSSLPLHWRMCQRLVAAVPDWSPVRTALDLGCSRRGLLLNSVALHLRRLRLPARVVGFHPRRDAVVRALRSSSLEGVQDYVTCREGDWRRLPFPDGYFDVVLSAVYLGGVGEGEEERGRALGELVRVVKGGGVGVLWDLSHVPEYVRRLREMGMEDIKVSEQVNAYLFASHIVSFHKPREHKGPVEWRVDVS